MKYTFHNISVIIIHKNVELNQLAAIGLGQCSSIYEVFIFSLSFLFNAVQLRIVFGNKNSISSVSFPTYILLKCVNRAKLYIILILFKKKEF